VPERSKCVLNCFSLRVKNRSFWHHPDVCFHVVSISRVSGNIRI
jgi:hypothetical protein